jgi:hypothetical protein
VETLTDLTQRAAKFRTFVVSLEYAVVGVRGDISN